MDTKNDEATGALQIQHLGISPYALIRFSASYIISYEVCYCCYKSAAVLTCRRRLRLTILFPVYICRQMKLLPKAKIWQNEAYILLPRFCHLYRMAVSHLHHYYVMKSQETYVDDVLQTVPSYIGQSPQGH